MRLYLRQVMCNHDLLGFPGVPVLGCEGWVRRLLGRLGFGQHGLFVAPWPSDFPFGISLALAAPSRYLPGDGVSLEAQPNAIVDGGVAGVTVGLNGRLGCGKRGLVVAPWP